MRFDVLTLFPPIFASYLGESLLKKAIDRGLIDVRLHDIRDWSHDKHQKVDDRPYGGGPGMLLKVEPVVECVEAVQAMAAPPGQVVLLTPQGERFEQRIAASLAAQPRVVLICGRYEGFDQRVVDILQPLELSLGDFVLNGGEVAAMAVIDAVARLVPGVLGDETSHQLDSFSGEDGWLEGAQYTRPREYRGHQVPEILLSGNHEQIARWRAAHSLTKTRERRADLLPAEPAAEPTRPAPQKGKSHDA